jgi:hypothetical protein
MVDIGHHNPNRFPNWWVSQWDHDKTSSAITSMGISGS